MFKFLYIPLQKILLSKEEQIEKKVNTIKKLEIRSEKVNENFKNETELWAKNFNVKLRINSKKYIEDNRSKVLEALEDKRNKIFLVEHKNLRVDKNILVEINRDRISACIN